MLAKSDLNEKDKFFIAQCILQFFYLNSSNTKYFTPFLEQDIKKA